MSFLVSSSLIKKKSQEFGLSYIASVDAKEALEHLKTSRHYLSSWQENGYNAEMEFMSKTPEFYTELNHILPETESILLFAFSYHEPFMLRSKPGYGKIARYAWGKDYHKVLKKRLHRFINGLREELPSKNEIKFRVFSDAVPILERALFEKTKKGFIGKNSLMIIPNLGSWTFIAEVFSNIKIHDPLNTLKSVNDNQSCGSCKRCQVACPTNALVEDFVLDSRKCISYLTIEKKDEFNSWESKAIDDWIFGCDICQEVCPFNHKDIPLTDEERFLKKNGSGPYLSLSKIMSISSREEFLENFAGTALMRAGLDKLQRNAIAISVNQATEEGREALECYLENNSSSSRSEQVRRILESGIFNN